MADVHATRNGLEVQLKGIRALLSGRRRMVIPWSHVIDAQPAGELARRSPGARKGVNTNVPGLLKAGSFSKDGKRSFWDVRHADKAIVVELRDEKFDQLVIEVDDPGTVLSAIRTARET
ncbi:MAG: hypothetical protein ABW224_16310 [Kibdelosporangium sp.]